MWNGDLKYLTSVVTFTGLFAESTGKLYMGPGSGKLLNRNYLPKKVKDAILQWSAMKQQETEESCDMQRAIQKSSRHLTTICCNAEWMKLCL